jgi:aquaporin Z
VAGRLRAQRLPINVVAQCLGAIVAAWLLAIIAKGALAGFGGGHGEQAAFLFEVIATFIFVLVILGATGRQAHPAIAGLAIGLTLVVIHLVGIRITGTSVNPARSLGPALMVGGKALGQLWPFIVTPLLGGALAGLVVRVGAVQTD